MNELIAINHQLFASWLDVPCPTDVSSTRELIDSLDDYNTVKALGYLSSFNLDVDLTNSDVRRVKLRKCFFKIESELEEFLRDPVNLLYLYFGLTFKSNSENWYFNDIHRTLVDDKYIGSKKSAIPLGYRFFHLVSSSDCSFAIRFIETRLELVKKNLIESGDSSGAIRLISIIDKAGKIVTLPKSDFFSDFSNFLTETERKRSIQKIKNDKKAKINRSSQSSPNWNDSAGFWRERSYSEWWREQI